MAKKAKKKVKMPCASEAQAETRRYFSSAEGKKASQAGKERYWAARRDLPPDVQQAFDRVADGKAYKMVMQALVRKAKQGDMVAMKMFLERAAVTRSASPASGDDYFKSLTDGQRKRLDSMFDDCMVACEKARDGQIDDIDRINDAKLITATTKTEVPPGTEEADDLGPK